MRKANLRSGVHSTVHFVQQADVPAQEAPPHSKVEASLLGMRSALTLAFFSPRCCDRSRLISACKGGARKCGAVEAGDQITRAAKAVDNNLSWELLPL